MRITILRNLNIPSNYKGQKNTFTVEKTFSSLLNHVIKVNITYNETNAKCVPHEGMRII